MTLTCEAETELVFELALLVRLELALDSFFERLFLV